jgi:hypothetical protein
MNSLVSGALQTRALGFNNEPGTIEVIKPAVADLVSFDPNHFLYELEALSPEKIKDAVSQLNQAQALELNIAIFNKYRRLEILRNIAIALYELEELRVARWYQVRVYTWSKITTPNFLGFSSISNKAYHEWENRK